MTLPNQLTIMRIVLSPVFLFLFLSADPLMKQISVGVFIIAALSDWYDGWLARKFNYITEWGKFMDPLADKILVSTAFIGFVLVGLVEWWMVATIIVRDFTITFLRIVADRKGDVFATSYYAKLKTLLQLIFLYYLLIIYVGSITPSLNGVFGNVFQILLNQDLIYFVMLMITLITVHTGYIYIRKNKDVLKKIFS
ncbi:MAG: CDP-diacylglycerol--glycerol-3-phosphate 3-phosphatidyltransferase [Ignavibacteria bacterium]|jgi:CDP-diacylglycerol---glycerol-3-phosphate 3-phosphatidyltransferase|nr:MAG: CDP-diacylglycerol--glycerol-3-phosphate 3-phosphatidyltransferase [Ignavibacteria bacterium]